MPDNHDETLKRLEPDTSPIFDEMALASIAVSLKRIADTLDTMLVRDEARNG